MGIPEHLLTIRRRRYRRRGLIAQQGPNPAGTARVLGLLKTGDIDRVMETPFGIMPLSSFIMFPTLDIVIHQWDLSKGIGGNAAIDADLAEACYGALQMGTEGERAQRAFAAEVTVPIAATIHDKLLALSGRTP